MRAAKLKILICLECMAGFILAATDPNQSGPSVTRTAEMLRREVELQRVSAIEPNQPTQTNALKQIVSQLQLLGWSANTGGPFEPNVTGGLQEQNKKAAQVMQTFAMVPQTHSGKSTNAGTTQINSLDEIQKPVNASAAADVLYQAKDFGRALRFYQMAAESKEKKDEVNRQWAMYQAANCLRYVDSDKAIAAYQQLITEYPNSAWTPAALIQQKNLEWFKLNPTVLFPKGSNDEAGRQ